MLSHKQRLMGLALACVCLLSALPGAALAQTARAGLSGAAQEQASAPRTGAQPPTTAPARDSAGPQVVEAPEQCAVPEPAAPAAAADSAQQPQPQGAPVASASGAELGESRGASAPAAVNLTTNVGAAPRPLPALSIVGVDMGAPRPLALREAIEMALNNNKDIEVARQNVRSAEFDLLGARGAYDLRFSANSFYERAEAPTASLLAGAVNGSTTQGGFVNSLRLEGLAPKFGGSYSADFSSGRVTTNNQFVALSPMYQTALTFSYTQPLLRGRRTDNNRRQIEIASKNLSLTDAQFRQRAIETITGVQRAYWDLTYALRNLQVQRDAVRDARAQLEHNKRNVEKGVLAPIDVVAADAQVLEFEQSLYAALEEVARAENALKDLIAEDRQSSLWNVSLVPTDATDIKPPAVSLPEALDTALANRPELQQLSVAGEINEIDRRYFEDQTKPQVDLVATYGAVGLAGTVSPERAVNPFAASTAEAIERLNQLSEQGGLAPLPPPAPQVFPETLVGGYGQSLGNLALSRNNTVRFGVTINLPFRNRTAEARLGNSLVEGERIKTRRARLEQAIQVDVRNALQAVRAAESRLVAAAALRQASEQQLSSEQRKFASGHSTFFFVLERQTALASARGKELRAQTDLNKATAGLQQAMGNALQAQAVVVRAR
jgi:outer membrane protein TolC